MFSGGFAPTGLGARIRESSAAATLPAAKPHTDDMRAMVEHLDRLGMIERRPAVFRFGNEIVIHPDLLEKLRARLARDAAEKARALFFERVVP